MLPKIVTGTFSTREEWVKKLSLVPSKTLEFDGIKATVSDFRAWLFEALGVVSGRAEYTIVIWNADELNVESQTVLLKPLEELASKTKLILVTENEGRLLPTIISRSELVYFYRETTLNSSIWADVRRCWSSGPAACIDFSDSLDRDTAMKMLEEVVVRLRSGLEETVNTKRVVVLDLAMSTLCDLKMTNINQKLLIDNFLIQSWRLTKMQ